MLQYRSVAFVTYVSELSAQFAKESMACQSLDNDEILNVRWATEDPNPTSKVQEQDRLEELGKKAIQERMDPRIVEAMRSVRALEDGDAPDAQQDEDADLEDGGADPRSSSRRDGGGEEDDLPDPKRRRINPPPAQIEEAPKAMGLLSADTVEGIKYFSEIRKRLELNGLPRPLGSKPAPAKPHTAALALAEYGSDDDE